MHILRAYININTRIFLRENFWRDVISAVDEKEREGGRSIGTIYPKWVCPNMCGSLISQLVLLILTHYIYMSTEEEGIWGSEYTNNCYISFYSFLPNAIYVKLFISTYLISFLISNLFKSMSNSYLLGYLIFFMSLSISLLISFS